MNKIFFVPDPVKVSKDYILVIIMIILVIIYHLGHHHDHLCTRPGQGLQGRRGRSRIGLWWPDRLLCANDETCATKMFYYFFAFLQSFCNCIWQDNLISNFLCLLLVCEQDFHFKVVVARNFSSFQCWLKFWGINEKTLSADQSEPYTAIHFSQLEQGKHERNTLSVSSIHRYTHTGRHKHAWIKFFQIASMDSDLDSIKEWSRSKLSENFRYRMVQKGLKIKFLNQKYLFFRRIFPLRNWEGTPLLPLTEKNPFSSFWRVPYSVMYFC